MLHGTTKIWYSSFEKRPLAKNGNSERFKKTRNSFVLRWNIKLNSTLCLISVALSSNPTHCFVNSRTWSHNSTEKKRDYFETFTARTSTSSRHCARPIMGILFVYLRNLAGREQLCRFSWVTWRYYEFCSKCHCEQVRADKVYYFESCRFFDFGQE